MMDKLWTPGRFTGAEIFLLGLLVLILIMTVILIIRLRRGRLLYQRRGPLFSPAELSFFNVLERAVDNRARIYAKVRLGDLVAVREGISGRRFWQAFNAVACKHVDYVLCDRQSHQVLGVIELDDRSHEREERRERDEFVDAVMQSAGIPILHFPARARYRLAEVRERLDGWL